MWIRIKPERNYSPKADSTVTSKCLLQCKVSSRTRGIHDVIRDAHNANHFGHVVNADDVGAAEDRRGDGHGSAEQAFAGRRARGTWPREGFAEKGFPRCANHDRASEERELGKPRENFEILLVFFSEPDSRV